MLPQIGDIKETKEKGIIHHSAYWSRKFNSNHCKIYVEERKCFHDKETNEIPREVLHKNMIPSQIKITCYLHTWKDPPFLQGNQISFLHWKILSKISYLPHPPAMYYLPMLKKGGEGRGVKDKPVALYSCSANLVPKCLEMPVTFLPSLDWLDGVRLAHSNSEPKNAILARPQRCIVMLKLVSTS